MRTIEIRWRKATEQEIENGLDEVPFIDPVGGKLPTLKGSVIDEIFWGREATQEEIDNGSEIYIGNYYEFK